MEMDLHIEITDQTIDVPYRELIGSLMFIATVTRPDISFAVSYLAQFFDKPNEECWKQAKKVVRYLKETKEIRLVYKRNEKQGSSIIVYSDSDWAGDKGDRKSVSGCVVLYNINIISWYSRKQNCVALSTAEAEYVAASLAAFEALNLKGVAQNLGENIQPKLLVDNRGAIYISKSYENSKRTKHIDIGYNHIKHLIKKGEINAQYIDTNNNLADIMTKAHSKEKIINFINCMNKYAPSRLGLGPQYRARFHTRRTRYAVLPRRHRTRARSRRKTIPVHVIDSPTNIAEENVIGKCWVSVTFPV
ncbi:hypothetical protein evm_014401 [Chilo suppressalis]|nr:hypothetical protein evm_014401 [Chilo suppressalis]